jgi:hypothetical protein
MPFSPISRSSTNSAIIGSVPLVLELELGSPKGPRGGRRDQVRIYNGRTELPAILIHATELATGAAAKFRHHSSLFFHDLCKSFPHQPNRGSAHAYVTRSRRIGNTQRNLSASSRRPPCSVARGAQSSITKCPSIADVPPASSAAHGPNRPSPPPSGLYHDKVCLDHDDDRLHFA